MAPAALWAAFLIRCCLQVYVVKGALHAACHFVWGMWLLVNICYHYYQAVHLAPGYTSDVDLQVQLLGWPLLAARLAACRKATGVSRCPAVTALT